MDIKIIYQDQDIIVIDKPSRITVNNSDTTKGEFTVQDFLKKNFPVVDDEASDFYKRSGIVHRIDKETSGILIVARNKKSFEDLQSQFKERKVKKTYIALVHGRVREGEGKIVVPVGRLPWSRKKFGVLAGGKEAITEYKVIKNLKKDFTLLEVSPKTGRTHQIRVHLKYFNHPIFGDFLYAGRKVSREDRKILDRVFLHAFKIYFFHPVTGNLVEFESALPGELKKTLELFDN